MSFLSMFQVLVITIWVLAGATIMCGLASLVVED